MTIWWSCRVNPANIFFILSYRPISSIPLWLFFVHLPISYNISNTCLFFPTLASAISSSSIRNLLIVAMPHLDETPGWNHHEQWSRVLFWQRLRISQVSIRVANMFVWGGGNYIRGRVNNSLQPSFFSSHGCIYTKVAVSTSNMNLCLSCHVTWTVLHAWLHYGIRIKTMHFGHC